MKILICLLILTLFNPVKDLFAQKEQPTGIEGVQDLCGSDDRTPFNHAAVGRIILQPSGSTPTTGWILFDGRIVTAAHIFTSKTSGYIYFNVPASNDCSSLGVPSDQDKYKIIWNSIEKPQSYSIGDDWAVFSVEPNSITGLTPYQAQNASFNVEQTTTPGNLQVIGFGKDTEAARCYASQSSSGTYEGLNGTIIKHKCDTEVGNSGSPIINTSTGKVVGIHTNGTCAALGYNQGTSTYNTSLWNALGASSTITVDQKREDGTIITGSTIKRWTGSSFQTHSIPATIPVTYGTNEFLRGSDALVTSPNEKFSKWNNYSDGIIQRELEINYGLTKLTSQFTKTYSGVTIQNSYPEVSGLNPSNDMIKFKDPWLLDAVDTSHSSSKINRGVNALFKDRISPFYPDLSTSYGGDVYKGILLNQNLFFDPLIPIYSVSNNLAQDIYLSQTSKTHKFYFQNWEASNNGADAIFHNANALETPIVFINANAEIMAVMKGTQLSSNVNGFNNNNQRKIIRTSNGHLHMVYESMGYIWYEYSTDYGSNWLLGNNNKPIEFDEGKNPSLDDYYGVLSVIYQGKGNGTGSTIKVASISNGVVTDTELIAELNDSYTNTEINPVIAFGNDQLFAAIWRGDCADQDFGVSKALNLRTGTISYDYTYNNYQVNVHTDQFYPASGRHIFNTDENSLNPCVEFYNGDDQNPNKLHIVWQQGTSSIKYERLEFTYSNNTLNYSTYALATLSTGSGFTNNYNPSITILSDNSPVVSWVGYRTLRDERLEKANAGTYEERIVLRRGYSSGSWSSVFNKYDDEVNTPSVNSALMGYALGWSSENGSTNKIVRSDYGNQIFTTTQVG